MPRVSLPRCLSLLCCFAMVAACADQGGRPPSPPAAVVRRTIDGDTISVVTRLGEETVRLLGVDAPETVHPRKPVGCFGREASRALRSLIPPGTVVVLSRDVETRDRYGRLLAYVRRASDGMLVNLEMVRRGAARPSTVAPNHTLSSVIRAAAARARAEGLGIWQTECTSRHLTQEPAQRDARHSRKPG
ncbi:MAG: hypothetical protein KatS3mg008_0640 [Acidimicrobiales bacterium]|nr:MAG: hypothetical protein KatS3mg008_0640 [Acidimicrobiales bacterium]